MLALEWAVWSIIRKSTMICILDPSSQTVCLSQMHNPPCQRQVKQVITARESTLQVTTDRASALGSNHQANAIMARESHSKTQNFVPLTRSYSSSLCSVAMFDRARAAGNSEVPYPRLSTPPTCSPLLSAQVNASLCVQVNNAHRL